MTNKDEMWARNTARALAGPIAAALLLALAGCATAPPPPEEMKSLVWPAPPLPTRIQFVRSIFSEEDLNRDITFNEKLVEFISGKKPPLNRIAEPMGLAVSDDGSRLYVSDYAQLAVFVFDFAQKKIHQDRQGGAARPADGNRAGRR